MTTRVWVSLLACAIALVSWWTRRRRARRERLAEGPQVQITIQGKPEPLKLVYMSSSDRKRRAG